LTEFAVLLEENAGLPQDIEWAVDRDGQLLLLQSRPLTVLEPSVDTVDVDVSGFEVLAEGGTTVCPGAGAGPVHHVRKVSELAAVPEGCVLVAPRPVPGLVAVIDRVVALVTEIGGVASHLATLAREYRVPAVMGLQESAALPQGAEVTLDATQAIVYAGRHPELVDARRPSYEVFHETDIYGLLRKVLDLVSPLNLLHPEDDNFQAANCRTLHDITRFAHQMAMEEMFTRAAETKSGPGSGLQLRSSIPLQVNLVYLGGEPRTVRGRWVREEDIGSEPMAAFWEGVTTEGWPKPPPVNLRGFMSVLSSRFGGGPPTGFSENSFAILSPEYMNLSLRLGYHFTTIEAMCTDDQSKNYIRIQYKHGGASIDRRVRRIRLITNILSSAGFDNLSRGDFLDSRIAYLDRPRSLALIKLLGRISIMTKQLDMALSSDAITEWYTRDFMKKLGLEGSPTSPQ
jgi:pyruvate,water dikinase